MFTFTQQQSEAVERGLRLLIGQTLHNAITARLLKESDKRVAHLAAEYEEAVEVYRQLFNKDPIARSRDDVLDERGFIKLT